MSSTQRARPAASGKKERPDGSIFLEESLIFSRRSYHGEGLINIVSRRASVGYKRVASGF